MMTEEEVKLLIAQYEMLCKTARCIELTYYSAKVEALKEVLNK